MPFEAILGQSTAIGTLERALGAGKVHHAYVFEGPDGVGKEAAAFALAQALVCESPPPAGQAYRACGKCSACTRTVARSSAEPHLPIHPDVVILERGLYSADALRRSRPELQEISVDQIRRLVLERASYSPHEGRARVFIMRRAHELSISAANALLKTLEEPLPRTHFVLLTDRGNELLPTIRSRSQIVRFAPLADAIVRQILERKGITPEVARTAADMAAGSCTAALELADPEAYKERRAFVEAVMVAARAPDLGAAIALSDARERDKGVLFDRMAALSSYFARAGRAALAADPAKATRAAKAHEIVDLAMDDLQANGNPALVLEAMVARLRHEI